MSVAFEPKAMEGSAATAHASRFPSFQWRGPGTPYNVRYAARSAVEFLSDLGFSREECFHWELLLTEAGNNAVLHAPQDTCADPRPIEFILQVHDDCVEGRCQDQTKGFDWPDKIDLPPVDKESGRGLFLISQLAQRCDYQRDPSGNTLTMVRPHSVTLSPVGDSPDTDGVLVELEDTLDEMTLELSACYESLATVFRFSEECREDRDLKALSVRLLRHVANATGTDCSVVRLCDPETGQLETTSVFPESSRAEALLTAEVLHLERIAVDEHRDQWFTGDGHEGRFDPAPGWSGLLHPFYDGDALMGVVTVGKLDAASTPSASDIQIIHTFADLLGQKIKDRRREAMTVESRVHRHEIELAASIQNSLLPAPCLNLRPMQFTGYCRSASQVGGDFYDYLIRDDGSAVFVIADVMGKGMGASMMAAITRSVIRTVSYHSASPALMLQEAANRLFADFERLEMFVTVAIGLIDPAKRTLCVANAGHCPVVVHVPLREDVLIEPSALPLGLEPDPVIKQEVIPLTAGAHVLGFTDGLLDPRFENHFTAPADILEWIQGLDLARLDAEGLKSALLERLPPSEAPTADDITFINFHFLTS